MSWISVCKNVIQSNNKRKWKDPNPAIRISKTKAGKAMDYGHEVNIIGQDGKLAATILSSTDGNAILKCGAKVAIHAPYGAYPKG